MLTSAHNDKTRYVKSDSSTEGRFDLGVGERPEQISSQLIAVIDRYLARSCLSLCICHCDITIISTFFAPLSIPGIVDLRRCVLSLAVS